jgi:hypothetical protein
MKTTVEDNGWNDFTMFYDGRDGVGGVASLYWLRHWLGNFLAEKSLEGPLSLHGDMHGHAGGYVNTSAQLVWETLRAMNAPGAYQQNSASYQHGVVWQLIASTVGRSLKEYPTDFARTWCHEGAANIPKFYGSDKMDETPPDWALYSCLHGFGHGVFFSTALSETHMKPSACNPLFPSRFRLSETGAASAARICDGAATQVDREMCLSGLCHSLKPHKHLVQACQS